MAICENLIRVISVIHGFKANFLIQQNHLSNFYLIFIDNFI